MQKSLTSVHIIDEFDFYSFHRTDGEYGLHGTGEQTRQERDGNFVHIFVEFQNLTLSICLCTKSEPNIEKYCFPG